MEHEIGMFRPNIIGRFGKICSFISLWGLILSFHYGVKEKEWTVEKRTEEKGKEGNRRK